MATTETTLWTSTNSKWRLVDTHRAATWTRARYVLYENETFSHTIIYSMGALSCSGVIPDYVIDAMYRVIARNEKTS